MKTNNKIVVMGLDGATWKILSNWIKKGKLPFLKWLMKNSAYSNLKSTIPPMTAPAWVSFQTGVNPGKHGVFDFVEYLQNGEEKIVNGSSVKAKKIWEILENYNKSSCVINMPVTYPPDKTKKSVIISSFLTPPDKTYISPPQLKKDLEKIGYKIDVKFERYGLFVSGKKIAKLRKKIFLEIKDISKKRFNTILYLAKLRDWDFFFTLFRGTDTVQHLFWKHPLTLDYYKEVDEYLKKIYNFFKKKYKDNLYFFIISDHGFYETPKINFSLYTWLYNNNYLEKPQKEEPILLKYGKTIYRFLKKINNNILKNKILKSLKKIAIQKNEKSYLTKARVKKRIWASAYGLYLNDKKINKEKVIKDLKKVKYKNTKVFKYIARKEKIYSGKYMKNFPDIILMSNFDFCIDANPYNFKLFSKKDQYLKGYHHSDRNGIFILNGKNIKPGKEEDVNIYDILPTSLHLLKVDIPKNLDGVFLNKLFKNIKLNT